MVNDIIKQVRVNGVNGDPNIDYDIAVDVDRVIFRNTEGDDTTDTTLGKILFENDNIASPFLKGEQSIVGYINDGNTVRDKISFGIYALVAGETLVRKAETTNAIGYPATIEKQNGDTTETVSITEGMYVGSFLKEEDLRKYALVENIDYDSEATAGYASCKYRTLTDGEVKYYLASADKVYTSILQRQMLSNNFYTLLRDEHYTASSTIAIANQSDIQSFFI